MPANVWAECIQIGMLQITNLESKALGKCSSYGKGS